MATLTDPDERPMFCIGRLGDCIAVARGPTCSYLLCIHVRAQKNGSSSSLQIPPKLPGHLFWGLGPIFYPSISAGQFQAGIENGEREKTVIEFFYRIFHLSSSLDTSRI